MSAIILFAIFTVALFTMGAYTVVARWWRYRSGRAYFVLFAALCFTAGHFVIEAIIGQSPDWWEDIVLATVLAALAWNCYTIISKQVLAWRDVHPKGVAAPGLILPDDGSPHD